jgi:hypothetical protein
MLMWFLSLRLHLLNHREDLNEIMQLSPMVANNGQESFNSRSLALDIWVWIAHQFRHPSTSTAYDCAMSSMQASLTFAPTLDVQHVKNFGPLEARRESARPPRSLRRLIIFSATSFPYCPFLDISHVMFCPFCFWLAT